MDERITEANYERNRAELKAANENLRGVVMREKEVRLNEKLREMKAEFRRRFPDAYDVPVLKNRAVTETELYRFLQKMPKGADLHVHDMALLPMRELIPLLRACPEFCVGTDRRHALSVTDPATDAPEGSVRLGQAMQAGLVTEDELMRAWTFAGADEKTNVWPFFEDLFERQAVLSDNPAFAEKYYDRAFRYYAENGITHVEIHNMLTESLEASEEYVRVIREAYYRVKKDCPGFSARVIGAGVKADNENIELTKKCFLNASYVQEVVRDESVPGEPEDFLIGFDLVNEEDSSLPLRAFAPMLLKVKRQYPRMKLYIHGGESLDAGNENLIDAFLLGVSRVGHGLNLYRYPDLHARYVKAEICLEVCPVSNQRLGYVRDVRLHPATEYLRTGAAIALCSDDPAYMENATLTDDFLAGTVGWDLDLADLKQLAINSLMYSGLTDRAKFAVLHAFDGQWRSFLERGTEE